MLSVEVVQHKDWEGCCHRSHEDALHCILDAIAPVLFADVACFQRFHDPAVLGRGWRGGSPPNRFATVSRAGCR